VLSTPDITAGRLAFPECCRCARLNSSRRADCRTGSCVALGALIPGSPYQSAGAAAVFAAAGCNSRSALSVALELRAGASGPGSMCRFRLASPGRGLGCTARCVKGAALLSRCWRCWRWWFT
jgi:hypothetical protein